VPALYATLIDLGLTTLAREDAKIGPATPMEVS
jgi:hypothetical protein